MRETTLVHRKEIDTDRWNKFVFHSPQGSLYAQSWFLDVVADNWSALIFTKGGEWLAAMPLHIKSKWGITYTVQPPFCQYLGPMFAGEAFTGRSSVRQKNLALSGLIKGMPSHIKVVNCYLSPALDYWFPFQQLGYRLQPRMNMRLNLQRPFSEIKNNFGSNITDHIKKAKRKGLQCRESEGDKLFPCMKMDVHYQNLLTRIWAIAQQRGNGFRLDATDDEGILQASGIFLTYKQRAVFLASGRRETCHSNGGNALLIAEAIYKCQSLGLTDFDFEGSMIPGVERFFGGFNPETETYYAAVLNKMHVWQRLGYFAYLKLKPCTGIFVA